MGFCGVQRLRGERTVSRTGNRPGRDKTGDARTPNPHEGDSKAIHVH
jgi:hypothetical protein